MIELAGLWFLTPNWASLKLLWSPRSCFISNNWNTIKHIQYSVSTMDRTSSVVRYIEKIVVYLQEGPEAGWLQAMSASERALMMIWMPGG